MEDKQCKQTERRVSTNAMSQNNPTAFTLNDVGQLIYFIPYTARCPRQTKNGRYFLPTTFRNIKAKKSTSVTSYTTDPKKVQVCQS